MRINRDVGMIQGMYVLYLFFLGTFVTRKYRADGREGGCEESGRMKDGKKRQKTKRKKENENENDTL